MSDQSEYTKLGRVLHANMRRILAERNITVYQFCVQTGIYHQTYYAAFKRPNGPQMGTVQQWADALGVPMSELLKEER